MTKAIPRAELLLLPLLLACGGTAGRPPAASVTAPVQAAPPAPEPPRPLDEAAIRAVAALLRMEDVRRLDPGSIESFFRDPHPEVRRRAALAAGRVGGPLARPVLLAALHDPDARVAESAAFALGELADSAGVVVLALAQLLDDATRPAGARSEAVAALGKLATPPACAAVRGSLAAVPEPRRGTAAGPILMEGLLATWRCADAKATVDAVVRFAAHADAEVRWRATYALMRTGAPATAAALVDLMDDPEPLVRALAARAFRASFADSARARDAARPALVRALADPHPHVRIQAINALGGWSEPALAEALIGKLDDGDGNVRIAAAQALGAFSTRAVSLQLRAVVEDPAAATGLRAAALTSLARVDAGAATTEAARWASADWLHRLLAVRAIAATDWALKAPLLRQLAGDRDSRVARAALGAVGRAADTTAAAYALYVQTLVATDPEVRAAAIAGLGRRANPADLTTLLDAYEAAQRDTIPAASLAIIDALASLDRAGVPVEHTFFVRFGPHANAQVRRRVLERFPSAAPASWADTASAPMEARTEEFYESVVRRYVAPVLAGQPAPRLEIGTRHGTIGIDLMAGEAPLTVHNMVTLIESGFYTSSDPLARRWHRVVPDFVLQDGDPRGDGSGGPRHRIRDEINTARYLRGAVGMALSGPDTGGSQFFIAHSPQPHLDGGYTVFGQVTDGLDAADLVVQEDLILFMRIATR